MTIKPDHVKMIIKKASKSVCHTKIAAFAWNAKGDLIMKTVNRPRFSKAGGGTHAEMRIMLKRSSVRTILLCRINTRGRILPIDPCAACAAKAHELGIRIVSVKGQ